MLRKFLFLLTAFIIFNTHIMFLFPNICNFQLFKEPRTLLITLDYDGSLVIMVHIEQTMENQTDTVKVDDNTDCNMFINSTLSCRWQSYCWILHLFQNFCTECNLYFLADHLFFFSLSFFFFKQNLKLFTLALRRGWYLLYHLLDLWWQGIKHW